MPSPNAVPRSPDVMDSDLDDWNVVPDEGRIARILKYTEQMRMLLAQSEWRMTNMTFLVKAIAPNLDALKDVLTDKATSIDNWFRNLEQKYTIQIEALARDSVNGIERLDEYLQLVRVELSQTEKMTLIFISSQCIEMKLQQFTAALLESQMIATIATETATSLVQHLAKQRAHMTYPMRPALKGAAGMPDEGKSMGQQGPILVGRASF